MRISKRFTCLCAGIAIVIAGYAYWHGGDSRSKADRKIIEQHIKRAIMDKIEKGPSYVTETGLIKHEWVPILSEMALDQKVSGDFRAEAFEILEGMSDDGMIQPFCDYYRHCRIQTEPCVYALMVDRTLATYFHKTRDINAISIFFEMLESDQWGPAFKMDAVRTLCLCQDATSNQVLKDLVLHNEAYPFFEHKAIAAHAIAQSGDDSVFADLRNFAFILLNEYPGNEAKPDISAGMEEGIRGLASMAKRNAEANRALLGLAEQFIYDTGKNYIYQDYYYRNYGRSLLPAVASVGQDEDLRFVEEAISNTSNEILVRTGIRALGEMGDVRTIIVLKQLHGYAEERQWAIDQIEKRLVEKK